MVLRAVLGRLLSTLIAIVGLSAHAATTLSAPPDDGGRADVVVLFREQRSHRQAAVAIEQSLSEHGRNHIMISLPADSDAAAQESALRELVDARPRVVATGGTKATLLALQALPETPVVFFMVPNAADAPFMQPGRPERARIAGVTTDIAPEAQLDWFAALLPDVRTVGVLTSARSRQTAIGIQAAATRRSIKVALIEASKDEFMPAIDSLNDYGCDAVVMLPDARVYNSVSVQRLLVWSLRQRKPISAFSAHVVKAGALTGQYSDNRELGAQVGRLIHRVLEGAEIKAIGLQYPEHFQTGVNERTARMIGISLDDGLLGSETERYGSE